MIISIASQRQRYSDSMYEISLSTVNGIRQLKLIQFSLSLEAVENRWQIHIIL